MADRDIENASQETPEIPELLQKVLVFALDEAKGKMEKGEDVVPFTTLVVKDNLFIETHPGDSSEECFDYAQHTVEGARGAEAYAFCYDGYIETDDGVKDALISEGGIPGEEDGYAFGYLYEVKGDAVAFEEQVVYVGEAPNFMDNLKDATEYRDDEIDSHYLADADEDGEAGEEA